MPVSDNADSCVLSKCIGDFFESKGQRWTLQQAPVSSDDDSRPLTDQNPGIAIWYLLLYGIWTGHDDKLETAIRFLPFRFAS
jgi:hypothetical protein